MDHEQDSQLTYQCRAMAESHCIWKSIRQACFAKRPQGLAPTCQLPRTGASRCERSLSDKNPADTVLYLAYGSNLSNETFRGNRGIKPLSQINVLVPELRLTFDLPGIAYTEPCFANTARRSTDQGTSPRLAQKSPSEEDYHKDRWQKGLIGVVYEVTPSDYAHIIATEGAGSSYHDVLVDCYPFASSDPAEAVPQVPTTLPFKAHTLFAPATPPDEKPPKDGGRLQRPDTSYAQPSARYLKLITDGAAECRLPYEYQDYLNDIRPYTITTTKQRIGQFVYLTLWMPAILLMFALQKIFTDEHGVAPGWLKALVGAIFQASWASYDNFFKGVFGDGERTLPTTGDNDDIKGRMSMDDKLGGLTGMDSSKNGFRDATDLV